MDVFKADLARLDEAAAKVNSMRESAENAVNAMHLVTRSLLEDVTLSIKNAETSIRQSHKDANSADTKAAIMNDFVQFLMESVDIRNANGLAFLAQAFVWQDKALVQKFINDSDNIVIFAKDPSVMPSESAPQEAPASVNEDSESPTTDSIAENDVGDAEVQERVKRTLNASFNETDGGGGGGAADSHAKKRRVSHSSEEGKKTAIKDDVVVIPQSNPSTDVESFVAHVEKKLGKAFANKWLRVVARQPWIEWATNFVPLLPGTTPRQVAFNQQLQQFFADHGRALWERYFFLGTDLHSKNTEPMHRFRRLRAAMGHLVHDLYTLEGADVFLFLERFPHPSWPLVFNNPMPLESFPNHSRELLAYFQDQCGKRWPTYHSYWTAPPTSSSSAIIEYGHEWYRPLAFIEWAASRSLASCMADQWTFMESDGSFFSSLLAAITSKRSTFDPASCPYVSASLPHKSLPRHWRFPQGPNSMYKWDPIQKQILINDSVATTPSEKSRRSSGFKRLSGGGPHTPRTPKTPNA